MPSLLKFPIVYRSLEQAINTLKLSEISKSVEVLQLLKMCSSRSPHSILQSQSFDPKPRPMSVIKPKMPFLVMEGLDGSGNLFLKKCFHVLNFVLNRKNKSLNCSFRTTQFIKKNYTTNRIEIFKRFF